MEQYPNNSGVPAQPPQEEQQSPMQRAQVVPEAAANLPETNGIDTGAAAPAAVPTPVAPVQNAWEPPVQGAGYTPVQQPSQPPVWQQPQRQAYRPYTAGKPGWQAPPVQPPVYPPYGTGMPYGQPPYAPNGYPYAAPPVYFSPEHQQKMAEKRAVKHTANHIGLGLLFFVAVSIVVQVLLTGVVVAVPSLAGLLQEPVFMQILNIVLTLIGFLGGGIIICKLQKRPISSVIPFNPPQKNLVLPMLMVGMGFCYVANFAVSMLQERFSGLIPFDQPDLGTPRGPWGFAVSILATAFFPALLEEFLFRGAVMGSLMKFGRYFAIFTSAALFGLLHGNFIQIPFAFMVGLILGFAVVETGSVWPAVLIHFTNNLLSVLLEYFGLHFGEKVLNTVFPILMIAIIMIGFFGVYLLCVRKKDILKPAPTGHISKASTRFGWVMGSGAIIAFLVYVAFEIGLIVVSSSLVK